MDVKSTFLHGKLDETIYMKQPIGFVKKDNEQKVCLLNRSLYGLKQSPRMWYRRFNDYMIKIGFSRSAYDCCVYWKCHKNEKPIYLLLYVDYMLLAIQSMTEIARVKRLLNLEFEMKDLRHAKKILGIELTKNRKEKVLHLSQVD